MEELLRVEHLDLGYSDKVIVSDLNFNVYEGDYLFVIGDNGSGKTTLMKTLLSLLKPLKGKIIFSTELKKNDLGYLPQLKNHQEDFPATVDEVVMSGFEGKDFLKIGYSKEERDRALSLMEEMGVSELKERSFQKLSGGQKQRVLLARALCAAEKLLVMDEPTNGLDQDTIKEFYELIRKLNEKGMAIIMISHDHEALKIYAKNVLLISDHIFYGDKKTYLKGKSGD